MPPRFFSFACSHLALAWAVSGALQAGETYQQLAEKSIQDYLAKHRRAAVTVGVVDSTGAHVFGFGQLKQNEPENRPDGKTIYQVGSITKVFTTTLLAEQVDLGRMKLDDPAQKYLPPELILPKEQDREITLVDLATHRSGLPRLPQLSVVFMLGSAIAENPYAGTSWNDMSQVLRTVWLSAPIGARYAYSNLGMGLLGQSLVHATKSTDYAELIEERISKPLGMPDTCIELDDEQATRLVQGYNFLGQMTPAWDFASLEGAGALYSTADDMLVFAAANLGLRQSNLSSAMQLAQEPQPGRDQSRGPMGLGWHIKQVDDPAKPSCVWHNGMTGGYASILILVPEKKFAVVILSNVAASVDEPALEIATALAKSSNQVAVEGDRD